MPRFSRTYADYIYGAFATNTYTGTTWASGGTINVEPKTVYCIGNATTFITDGVQVGDTITLDVGGETATILAVDSETRLYTTALSATGTYDSGEAFTITRNGSAITTGVVAATNPETIICIDSTATFLTDGVMSGDTVTMTVGGETATVSTVHSETRLTTTALSGAGTYDGTEAFTIGDGDIFRIIVDGGSTKSNFIRKINATTDDTTGSIQIIRGTNSTTPIWKHVFNAAGSFDLIPDIGATEEGVILCVELDISTEADSSLNVSWETS